MRVVRGGRGGRCYKVRGLARECGRRAPACQPMRRMGVLRAGRHAAGHVSCSCVCACACIRACIACSGMPCQSKHSTGSRQARQRLQWPAQLGGQAPLPTPSLPPIKTPLPSTPHPSPSRNVVQAHMANVEDAQPHRPEQKHPPSCPAPRPVQRALTWLALKTRSPTATELLLGSSPLSALEQACSSCSAEPPPKRQPGSVPVRPAWSTRSTLSLLCEVGGKGGGGGGHRGVGIRPSTRGSACVLRAV